MDEGPPTLAGGNARSGRLSDALHEKLTQRFVDLRASVLVRKMQDSHQLLAGISLKGEVSVEGYKVGNLNGLSFSPNLIKGSDPKPVLAAVRRVLPTELKSALRILIMILTKNSLLILVVRFIGDRICWLI